MTPTSIRIAIPTIDELVVLILPTGRTLARLLRLYQTDRAYGPPASRAQLAEIMDALIEAGS